MSADRASRGEAARLEWDAPSKPRRKSPQGAATNDLVFSASRATNDEVFPQILELYVAPGAKIADVTYGKGVFWKRVDRRRYDLKATDLKDGVDARDLPYEKGSLDCVVFDPPYMHTPGGTAHVDHQNYEAYYSNNKALSRSKYHEAVLDLYFDAAKEAYRVLKKGGIYIDRRPREERDASEEQRARNGASPAEQIIAERVDDEKRRHDEELRDDVGGPSYGARQDTRAFE